VVKADGPWNRKVPTRVLRFYIYLLIVAGILASVWLLAREFPQDRLSGLAQGQLVYLIAWLCLIASGIVLGSRFALRHSLRNVAIWTTIFAILGLGYLYRDFFADTYERFRAEILPAEPVAVGEHTLVLTQSDTGEFVATGTVNGTAVSFLIDTGASDIVLAPQDAQRIGVDVSTLTYNLPSETANGIGNGAPLTVNTLTLGRIDLQHVSVVVNQAPMGRSLLGLAFLRRLKSFSFSGQKLTLRF